MSETKLVASHPGLAGPRRSTPSKSCPREGSPSFGTAPREAVDGREERGYAVVGSSFIAVIVVVAGSMPYWFGLTRPVTNAGPAQGLCEDAVRHDLLAPTDASFRDVYAKLDHLSEDDNVGLGFDAAHVKEVWAAWAVTSNHPARPELQRSPTSCAAHTRSTVNRRVLEARPIFRH
jgi:hypothetical protein